MIVFPRILELLREQGADHIAVIGGGTMLPKEMRELKARGVAELWGVDSSTDEIVQWITQHIQSRPRD
jgi:methylmalonyl-CoA mutase C-terminal domain/subunit